MGQLMSLLQAGGSAAGGAASSAGSWLGSQGGGADASANAAQSQAAGMAGTAIQTGSPILGGIAAANAYGQSAEYARLNAIDASAQGDWNATAAKMQYTGLANKADVGFASEGVGLSGGNVAATKRSILDVGRMDSDILHYKASRQAWGYLSEAAMDKTAGTQALLGGISKGAAGFLSGASSLASKWGSFQQQGLGGGGGDSSGFTADAGDSAGDDALAGFA